MRNRGRWSSDDATFHSKKGLVLKRFSRLAADVRPALGVRSAIFDGEVLAIDGVLEMAARVPLVEHVGCGLLRRPARV